MRSRIAVYLFLAGITPAAAHVTLAEPKAAAGIYYVGTFRVGHGCSGSPTTALRIEIPEAIANARPQPKPGWVLEIEHVPLPKPVAGEMGETVTSRVSAITWKDGSLPADQFDEFAVMMKLPAAAGALFFTATQTCAAGVEHWSDAPVAGMRMPHPAPTLTVVPATSTPDVGVGGMMVCSVHFLPLADLNLPKRAVSAFAQGGAALWKSAAEWSGDAISSIVR